MVGMEPLQRPCLPHMDSFFILIFTDSKVDISGSLDFPSVSVFSKTFWFSYFIIILPDTWLISEYTSFWILRVKICLWTLYILTIQWLFKECLGCGFLTIRQPEFPHHEMPSSWLWKQDQLCTLRVLVENENVMPFIKKFIRLSRQWWQSIKPRVGSSWVWGIVRLHRLHTHDAGLLWE